MTRLQSKEFCEANGLGMVKISNELDQTRITDYLNTIADENSEKYFWIGLSDQGEENHFVWEDGSGLSYSNWATNEPNDHGNGEDCVHLLSLSSRTWNDLDCSTTTTDWGVSMYALCTTSSTATSKLLLTI